jgi:hypothetical protein
MKNLIPRLTSLMAGLLLASFGSAFADEDAEYTCEESSENVSSIIDDWYLLVKDSGAEAKNASVIAMHADNEKGVLVEKLQRQCTDNWAAYEDVFTCFSGVRSEIGAAMCLHPDTNKSDWRYE